MKIFISHAAKDKKIAQALIDLLRLGGAIPNDNIFCSSYSGKIPNGKFFVEHILKNLNESNLFIALLSRNYMKSKFCLGEVGAAQVRNIAGFSDLFTLLIPPATYSDLDAVLYGAQSGDILQSHNIDELLDKVIKGAINPPNTVSRNAEKDKFFMNAKCLVGIHESSELLSEIKTQDLLFDRCMNTQITYKMKLRMVFRNETGYDIIVGKPRWSAKAGEVQCRPDEASSVQVEVGAGWMHGQWSNEGTPQEIRINQSFRIWIGLNWDISDAEFRQRHEKLEVGTLNLPVRINSFDVELTKKL